MNAKEELRVLLEDPKNTLTKETQSSIEDIVKKLDTNPERPVVVHKHTQGELAKGENIFGEPVVSKDGVVVAVFKPHVPEFISNRDLYFRAGDLLQIAEMYFDSMVSRGEQGSLPFQITSKILNELNGEEIKK